MTENHGEKELLTREEVMELLKIGRSTFYRLLQTWQLKGFKEGNRYKVPVSAVEEYVKMKMRKWYCEKWSRYFMNTGPAKKSL